MFSTPFSHVTSTWSGLRPGSSATIAISFSSSWMSTTGAQFIRRPPPLSASSNSLSISLRSPNGAARVVPYSISLPPFFDGLRGERGPSDRFIGPFNAREGTTQPLYPQRLADLTKAIGRDGSAVCQVDTRLFVPFGHLFRMRSYAYRSRN